jgi:hypothetical protein
MSQILSTQGGLPGASTLQSAKTQSLVLVESEVGQGVDCGYL